MFRDRLRHWGINDKNRRGTVKTRRNVVGSAKNEDLTFIQPVPSQHTAYCGPSQPILPRIENVLHTPDETRQLQRVLKGVLDWQQQLDISQNAMDKHLRDEYHFTRQLDDIAYALELNRYQPLTCRKVTRELQRKCAELRSCMGVSCTPLAIFRSAGHLLWFAKQREGSAWHFETSKFLVKAAAEALPSTHPTLLLLHLLSGDSTPAQLVTVYGAGSCVMQRCHGRSETARFAAGFLSSAIEAGLDAAFGSDADKICATTSSVNHSGHLILLAQLCLSTHRYKESTDAIRRCLAKLEDEGDGVSWDSTEALWFLARLQFYQGDLVGEEISLQNILAITLALDEPVFHGSHLSLKALRAISNLDMFYQRNTLKEKRDALCLKYPSAFEL